MNKLFPLALAVSMSVAMPAMAMGGHMKGRGDYYFQQMDRNGDNMISRSEHDAYMRSMFNEADTNNDNMISHDEMMARKQRMHDKYSSNDMRYGSMSPSAGAAYHDAYPETLPGMGSQNDQVYSNRNSEHYWSDDSDYSDRYDRR